MKNLVLCLKIWLSRTDLNEGPQRKRLSEQVAASTCVPRTPPTCIFLTSQHTEGLGVEIQVFFFFLLTTPWQLEYMLGPLNRFLSHKNKMCWIRQRQTFTFYFWTPMRAVTNATPPPLRLCHDCVFFSFFFFPFQKCHKLEVTNLYGTNRQKFIPSVHRI